MSTDIDHDCERCGADITYEAAHVEIVRREFRDEPRPSKIEYLCGSCLDDYERGFLDGGSGT